MNTNFDIALSTRSNNNNNNKRKLFENKAIYRNGDCDKMLISWKLRAIVVDKEQSSEIIGKL